MIDGIHSIVVAGDVTIDWFMYPVKALDEGENWRLHNAKHSDALIGGAALLSTFIKLFLDEENIPNMVNGPDLSNEGPLRDISPDKVIHSNVVLDNFKVKGDKKAEVLRIVEFIGYIGPPDGELPSWDQRSNNVEADIIVLDDAGNGFREMPAAWPQPFNSVENPTVNSIVLYKMSLPLFDGSLWDKVIEDQENPPENLIVIINANDLRRMEGIHISRSLSWERTAKDFVFALQNSDELNSLKKCPYLLVLFDTDGAILYRRKNDVIDAIIVFDPSLLEGDFSTNLEGNMMGVMSIFTATLVKQLTKEGFSGLTTGIKQGLANSRALIEIGYKNDGGIKYPALKDFLHIFSWGDIPGNDNRRLIEFLVQKFDIDWVKTANIEKTKDDKIVRLTEGNNSIHLKLNNEKPDVKLEINDGRTYKLIVKKENNKLNIYDILSKSAKCNYVYSTIELPTTPKPKDADPKFWRILDYKTHNTRQCVAREIVLNGTAKGLKSVPICEFGDLKAIDRAEIESYSAIKELIMEFRSNKEPKNPLCFAVFGPPGSGKSFGVEQVLKSIDPDEVQFESMLFNLSQFSDYQDLVNAFHKVRDVVLSGKVPFVFFDEFDSVCGDQPLGWLKYFLAPMQDGEFKEGEAIHPIGNAIFVFAGGTRHTFENFETNLHNNDSVAGYYSSAKKNENTHCIGHIQKYGQKEESDNPEKEDRDQAEKAFRDAKGPDFVSRLRGFINVMGPNRQRTKNDYDDAFIIRRAQVLRVLLEKDKTASGLFNSKKELSIDDGVLRAMLNVTKYNHGTRSMKAFVEMSRLAGKKRFDLSALPVKKQLDMHVDADEFLFLTKKERYQSMLLLKDRLNPEEMSYRKREDCIIECLARVMCKKYKSLRKGKEESVTGNSFEDFKSAAEDIPNKLLAINHGIRKIEGKTPLIPLITDDEVAKFASSNDDIIQNLFPRDKRYANEEKGWWESVYAIPVILQEIGYEMYRLEEIEKINDPYLIERLARLLHDKYIEERKGKGETFKTNKALVEFDKLSQDLKDTNIDNVSKIPEKLNLIGYKIRRIQQGECKNEVTLSDDQIEIIAKEEHDRWVLQKIMQGWVYSEGEKNFDEKTSPYIVQWDKLSPDIQDNDLNPVRLISEMLKEVGYEIYEPNSEKND